MSCDFVQGSEISTRRWTFSHSARSCRGRGGSKWQSMVSHGSVAVYQLQHLHPKPALSFIRLGRAGKKGLSLCCNLSFVFFKGSGFLNPIKVQRAEHRSNGQMRRHMRLHLREHLLQCRLIRNVVTGALRLEERSKDVELRRLDEILPIVLNMAGCATFHHERKASTEVIITLFLPVTMSDIRMFDGAFLSLMLS